MPIVAHGIDIVEVKRIAAMLEAHGRRFVERCFTDAEQAYAEAAGGAAGSKRRGTGRRQAERYAVRFACKEAVLKALGTGWRSGITWRDIEVRREPSGQPRLVLTGRCAELAAQMRPPITRWHVSLSHTDSVAIASVIGCG